MNRGNVWRQNDALFPLAVEFEPCRETKVAEFDIERLV